MHFTLPYALKPTAESDLLLLFLKSLHDKSDADFSQAEGHRLFSVASNIRLFEKISVGFACYSLEGVTLSNIIVDETERGKGLGRRALILILEIADELALPMNLYPRAHSRSLLNSHQLAAWYERYGFIFAPGGHYRPPQSNACDLAGGEA